MRALEQLDRSLRLSPKDPEAYLTEGHMAMACTMLSDPCPVGLSQRKSRP